MASPRKNLDCWSELPVDLMQMVFERLGLIDLEQARCVCSSWRSGSRKPHPNNKIPWIIIFPLDKKYALLLNPQEKEKLYKTKDLSNDFEESLCLTTYRTWLLMRPIRIFKGRFDDYDFSPYIFHLLTRERINLPLVVTRLDLQYPKLWIDEQTKDYLVIGMVIERDFSATAVYLKKGDNSWKVLWQLPGSFFDAVFKDHKLYCIASDQFSVFDFDKDMIPLQVFGKNIDSSLYNRRSWYGFRYTGCLDIKNCMVVTQGGDPLIVNGSCDNNSQWGFNIYKLLGSIDQDDELEQVFSLGDASIIMDLSLIILAKDLEGIVSNSIYFTDKESRISIYNLDSKKVERPNNFIVSNSIYFTDKESIISIYNLDSKKVERPNNFVTKSDQDQSLGTATWFLQT